VYHVYVIELSDGAGPRVSPQKPNVYVGQTVRDPQVRFAQHLTGVKASRVVRRFGVRLRPRLYRNYGPYRSRDEALEGERDLAARLRRRGFTVHGGH
jgi:predicted GIY-YIG superfamily endonuclease